MTNIPEKLSSNLNAADPSLVQQVDAAFEFLYPVFIMSLTRFNAVDRADNDSRTAPNSFAHWRELADHTFRAITTPNNDTLYSQGWLDLSGGPVAIKIPMIPDRYWSVQFMDIFTNTIAMLGSRLDGHGPVEALIVGPHWQGDIPVGMRTIRTPGNDVWLLARWLVDGPADAAAVHRIQDAVRIEPWSAEGLQKSYAARVTPVESSDPENFLAIVNDTLRHNPVPENKRALLAGWAPVGVQSGDTGTWSRLSQEVRDIWKSRMPALHAGLRAGLARSLQRREGWAMPLPILGNYGNNYGVRAVVALVGLGALEPAEAVYLGREADPSGAPLEGSRCYQLHIPSAGVPVRAFWSLTMYEMMPDGRRFFAENPIRRYSVGDRTPGLAKNPDGSIDIWIQQTKPTGNDAARATNWLPSPPGPFRLSLRAYDPYPSLLDGTAALPTIERVDQNS